MKVGTLLREVWLQCGESDRPCKFDKWMRRLDGWGSEWAAGNVDRIVGWMKDEARNRGMEVDVNSFRGIVIMVIRRSEDGTGSVANVDERSTEPIEAGEEVTPAGRGRESTVATSAIVGKDADADGDQFLLEESEVW